MAIELRELRRGNFVDYHGMTAEVFDIFGNAVKLSFFANKDERVPENNNVEGINLFPLALTEKWMEEFGMVTLDNEIDIIVWGFAGPRGNTFCYVSDGFDNPLPIYFEYDSGTSNVRREMKWVHELQNLHFALTDEELKIKDGLVNHP